MDFEEKVQSTKRVFTGHLIQVDVQDVVTPKHQAAKREIVRHVPSIGLLMINDDNEMLLEKQWRAPVASVSIEIPAGKLDDRDNGDPRHAAMREMNEETRLTADHLEKITGAYSSIGFCDEYMTIYMATGLHPVANELPQDADEEIKRFTVSQKEALQMVKDGKINDMKTVLAIFYWASLNKD
ncbi:NUDIX hydrolase [Limosilactobacillus secaliphilus]|nr:NUDIX hydrolase [Limosilactobacillus secaliphilus]